MSLRFWIAVSALFLFTACENTPTLPRYQPYTIGQSEPLYLNVNKIEFIGQYQPPFAAPNVEHLFPIKPYDAIHTLVENRIQTSPMSNATLKVTITDASVVEEALPTTPGLKGAFINDQSEQYKGRIEVSFEIPKADPKSPYARFTVKVGRSGTIDERASYQERQDFFNELTKGMIEQLNTQMTQGIRQYFTDFQGSATPAVHTAPNPWPNSATQPVQPLPAVLPSVTVKPL